MVKILFTSVFLLVVTTAVFSQKDCSHDHTGLIPITDLGAGTYRGEVGGLYPDGSNQRPYEHLQNCFDNVELIKPLDAAGNYDPVDGKVVMLAIGASNPHDEFTKMKYFTEDFEPANDHLVLINGCMATVGIQDLNTGSLVYWNYIENSLLSEGLTAEQVQVIWLEEENTFEADTSFPGAPSNLVEDYHALLMLIKDKFPNAQICYISARVYSGFASSGEGLANGLLFPRDYLNGWAVKWLIGNQISGEPGYEFEGPDASVPLITWGSYHWSDGSTPRADGFYLDCEDDLEEDGLHLSVNGITKIGQAMFDYFASDTTAHRWFYDEGFIAGIENEETQNDLIVYPNPLTDHMLHLQSDALPVNEAISVSMYALDGSIKFEYFTISSNEMEVMLPELAEGIYLLTIRSAEQSMTQKVVLTH